MDKRFKIGDTVKVVHVTTGIRYYNVGDVLTICKIDEKDDCMTYLGIKKVCGGDCRLWLRNSDIVAYKEQSKKQVKYHVGQKIRLKEPFEGYNPGDIAEITKVDDYDERVPVMIRTPSGDCVWIHKLRFELLPIEHPVVVITTDGNETKSRLMEGKKTIREATARCSDDDKFDFETGAKIAFNRLIGRETKPEKSRSKFKPGMVCKVVKEAKNIFGTAIVQPGDFVEIKSIDGECMTCHGFSRAEQRFADNICLKDDILEAIS